MQIVMTPELLLEAYRQGLFPMAYSADSPYMHWICPEMRGQISIPHMHISRSLERTVRKNKNRGESYQIKVDTAFSQVIKSCAERRENRPETWINQPIIDVFIDLHKKGHAHSIEYWEGAQLKGGLYGLVIGGAFFGESMFSRTPNASKIVMVHLVARLWAGGFTVFDTQFVNEHLKQFGVYELPHKEYMGRLGQAIHLDVDFKQSGKTEAELVAVYLEIRASGGVSHPE